MPVSQPLAAQIGVAILAGGQATRLPGKLERNVGRLPLIARVYRNVSAGRETVISCNATFPAGIDELLTCPMIVDRWPLRGPLAGLLSAMSAMRSRYVFAVAGDAPFVTSAFIERLGANLRPGDEAVVPIHEHGIEPLAAIYERAAFLRAGVPLLCAGKGALRPVIGQLVSTYVRFGADERVFTNVNTPADYAALHEVL